MMLDLMRVANREEDEASTKLVKKFLASEVPLDEFCRQILPMRTQFKARHIKIGKLRELVRQQHQQLGYPVI